MAAHEVYLPPSFGVIPAQLECLADDLRQANRTIAELQAQLAATNAELAKVQDFADFCANNWGDAEHDLHAWEQFREEVGRRYLRRNQS
jgi:hypothetical protein